MTSAVRPARPVFSARRRRNILLAGAAAIALVGALPVADEFTAWRLSRILAPAGTVDAVSGALFGPLAVDGLRLATPGATISIDRIVLPGRGLLGSSALAAGDVTLEGVSVVLDGLTLRMPRILVSGTDLDQATIARIFDKAATQPLSERLAALTASAVRIPELTMEQTVGDMQQTVTYHDIEMRDIRAGVISAIAVPRATMRIDGKKEGLTTGSMGPITIDDFDTVQTARVYGEKAGPGDTDPKRLYGAFSVENFSMRDAKGNEVGVARISGRDFKARPTADSWLGTIDALGKVDDFEKLSSAERKAFFMRLVDMMTAFEIGGFEASGFTFKGKDEKKGEPIDGEMERIAMSADATGPSFSVTGMRFVTPDAEMRFGGMSFSEIVWRPMLERLKEALAAPDTDFEDLDARKFVPLIGHARIEAIDIDIPADEDEPRRGKDKRAVKAGERIKMAIGAIDLKAGNIVDDIPTELGARVDHFAMALPAGTDKDGLKELRAMGYEALDLSFALDAAWAPDKQELAVKTLSFNGKDMGAVTLSALLGNVTKDIFSSDEAIQQVALMSATAKRLSFAVENGGIFERFLEQEAKKQKRKPDDLRKEYGMGAAIVVPAFLGNSEGARTLANAVARFVAKPGALNVTATANNAGGLGLADFAAAGGEPATLFEQVTIEAKAE